MENNDFKKNVQEQLSGLRFEPSDDLWLNVQEQLKKEKRRRGIIFFWLLLGCLLPGGFLINYFNTDHSHKNIAVQTGPVNRTVTRQVKDTFINHETIIQPAKNKSAAAIIRSSSANTMVKDEVAIPAKKITSAAGKTKITIRPPGNGDAKDDNGDAENKTTSVSIEPEVSDSSSDAKPGIKTVIELKKQHIAAKKNTDSTIAVVKQSSKKDKIKNSWVFDFTGSIGMSNIGKGFTLGIKSNENKSLGNGSSLTGGIPTPPVNIYNIASPFTKGFAFVIGVETTKKLNKYFSFVTGLQYYYLSAGSATGQRYDTAAAFMQSSIAFRQGFTNTYNNRFQFISIPVNLQTRVFAKKHFSGDLITGVSLMQLISGNALVYDTAQRLYFKNNTVFNKTTFAFNAGFLFSYSLKNKITFSAGPQFMHALTAVGKSDNYSGNYFKLWALKAKYVLRKKNK